MATAPKKTETGNPVNYSFDVALPPILRGRIGSAEAGPLTKAIQGLPEPKGGKSPSFFWPADGAPATITDAKEREQVEKDNVRKLGSRASSVTRRLSKDDKAAYAVRAVTEGGKKGIRVFRINPPAPVPQSAAQPAAQLGQAPAS